MHLLTFVINVHCWLLSSLFHILIQSDVCLCQSNCFQYSIAYFNNLQIGWISCFSFALNSYSQTVVKVRVSSVETESNDFFN